MIHDLWITLKVGMLDTIGGVQFMRYLIGVLCLTTAIACDGAYFQNYYLKIVLAGIKSVVDQTAG